MSDSTEVDDKSATPVLKTRVVMTDQQKATLILFPECYLCTPGFCGHVGLAVRGLNMQETGILYVQGQQPMAHAPGVTCVVIFNDMLSELIYSI